MMNRTVTDVEAFTGLYVDFVDPKPEQIELADIARGLAQTCRFASQTTRFYSVAEHAIYVADLVIEAGHPELALAALHHDSHEAYLGDWPSPLKFVVAQADPQLLKRLSDALDLAIIAKLGIAEDIKSPIIKRADEYAMRREAATLKYSHGVGPHWGFDAALAPLAGIGWDPDEAERKFLKAHRRLTK